jgi:hypothetical protein
MGIEKSVRPRRGLKKWIVPKKITTIKAFDLPNFYFSK